MNMRAPRLFFMLAVLSLPLQAAACIGGQTGSEAKHEDPLDKTEPCDPLGEQPEAIALGEILGIGRDESGTLYVADEGEGGSDLRAFVSQGKELVRERVTGTGSSHADDRELYQLSVDAASGAFTLVIERGPQQTRMARVEGTPRVRAWGDLGAGAELLEVLEPDAIDGMPLRNLPGEITTEYFARDESGKLLLVLRPVVDFAYEDARLFYGEQDALAERELGSFQRARDGGTTHLLFELDGVQADAFFPVEFGPNGFMPGPATLTVDGQTTALERLDATADAALLYGAQLRCLR